MATRIDRLDSLLCPAGTTVKAALARINAASPNLFQVIVDGDWRVARGSGAIGELDFGTSVVETGANENFCIFGVLSGI